jgi:hypothetical protein
MYKKRVEKTRRKKKHVPMAQTTRLVSSGPVFVVTTFHLSSRRVFRRVQPICTIKH